MSSKRLPHGNRMQEVCLLFIEERIDSMLANESIEDILRQVHQEYKVPIRTLFRWYSHFEQTGEYSYETKAREKRLRRLYKKCKMTTVITTEIV